MDAMRILLDEWEAMEGAGDLFCLDMPAHLLAYVRARAYDGAEEAYREVVSMRSLLNDLPLRDGQRKWCWSQHRRMSRLQVAYLQVLLGTIETFAPAPRQER